MCECGVCECVVWVCVCPWTDTTVVPRWEAQKNMLDYGNPKEQDLSWLDIQTPIMPDAKLRERAHWAHVNYWKVHLCLGHQRSKIVYHFQPLKRSTFRSVVAVLNYFGWRLLWVTLESSSKTCHCYVTMRVPWSSPTTWFNMQEQSTLMSATISLVIINKKGDSCIESVGTKDQLADIFTKPLDEKRFCKLRNKLNILDFSNICWCTPTYMTCLSFEQSKVKVDWHAYILC